MKPRQRGYDEATFVESFVILNAAGGEGVDDFERLRQDPGLAEMIGHGMPSPRAALEFLPAFHQEEKIEEAHQQRLPEQIAYIPDETPALEGLGRVNGDLVRRCGERTPDQRLATVDQDATIIESHKQQALTTYDGVRGYPRRLAAWAETGPVLTDEFRDGNVPAQMEPLEVAQRAFAALPGTIGEYYYRGDSACHESGLVNWLRDEQRSGGPRGRIGFAIRARISEPLHAAMGALPSATEWLPIGTRGFSAKVQIGNVARGVRSMRTGDHLGAGALRLVLQQKRRICSPRSLLTARAASGPWLLFPRRGANRGVESSAPQSRSGAGRHSEGCRAGRFLREH